MSERAHLLVQQWLQEALPENDLSASLQNLSETFPFFSAAHLLRFQKVSSDNENSAAWKKEAALHVYNPLQLESTPDDKMFQMPFDEKATETWTEVETTEAIIPEEKIVEAEPIIPERALTKEDDAPAHIDPETIAEPILDEPEEEEVTRQDTVNFDSGGGEPALKIPSINLGAPAGNITFEPYHTVDYFASQGIKLTKNEVTNDQFGKQLKSFTDWLKTMKKLPTTAITHNTDGAGERKVENLAAHSLQNTDIITESMAEVWIKQGNLQKASEVYNKLSLQNPSKKAYFAAKIESLKKPS